MKKIDQFTNQYPLHKTLRFVLQPMGETENYLNERLLVQNDERRSENAYKVKEYMDRCYKRFIESVLSNFALSDVDRYAELFFNNERTDEENEEMQQMEEGYRKAIAKAFENDADFKKMFGKEMFTELLPKVVEDDEELAVVMSFHSFTTFFTDFYKNRKNIYAADTGACSVAYRCVDDNLPKFLGNVKMFAQVSEFLPAESMKRLSADLGGLFDCEIENVFTPGFFNNVLTQTGIDLYNTIIGGYSTSDGAKIKGLNEYINLYNQTVGADGKKLPFFKPLYKQILSDRETISFVAEQFQTDEEVLAAIGSFCNSIEEETLSLEAALTGLKTLASNIRTYDPCGIFVAAKDIANLSRVILGDWSAFHDAWNKEYDTNADAKKNKATKAYAEKKEKDYKKIKSFSLDRIQAVCEYCDENQKNVDVAGCLEKELRSAIAAVLAAHDSAEHLWLEPREDGKTLTNDENAVQRLKAFLDAVKDLEHTVKLLLGTGKEDNRDAEFYNALQPLFDKLATMDRLYERVKNYVTKKPYSKEKIKLTFNKGDFFSGWAQDFGKKGTHIIRRGNDYYLMIVEQKLTLEDVAIMEQGSEENEAIRYGYCFVKADNKTVPKMLIHSMGTKIAPAVEKHNLPVHDVLDLYDNRYFLADYAKKDPVAQRESLATLIDYFKLGFSKHDSLCKFNCPWKPTEEYRTIADFYHDAERFCYTLSENKVNLDGLLKLVKEGKIYLFRFNNKDFSEYSKGKPNMHTLYFKALFSAENLAAPIFKLDGGAEMFYRKASISDSDKIVHPALYPINNKNPDNEKSASVFEYDIVKDRRFTKNQYFVHIPITMNFGASGSDMEINKKVRAAIKNADETYVIGIDRGEKNLIFATVIDGKGAVVEQRSFNIIRGVDYHALLERKANERQQARRDWKTINNIANIKEGYISYVVREVCDMVMKYDAIVALEDLNSTFKNSRAKIEKQVYQKFEKMLIDKLNFLAVKDRSVDENGGLLHAYQLTSAFKSFDEMRGQNGVVFFVPAWFTSKTEPSTGFANQFNVRCKTVKDAKNFFDRFEDIRYNAEEDYFEFAFNYSAFDVRVADYTNAWTVCSHGDRVHNFKDPENNNAWTSKNVVLTAAFKELFDKYGIDYTKNLKKAICERVEKDFFERLTTLFSLTVQVRNSYIGDVDEDFVISPCKDKNGVFFDSRNYKHVANATVPASADANDAYNIARKGLWAVNILRETQDELLPKVRLSISNKDWLRYAQESRK